MALFLVHVIWEASSLPPNPLSGLDAATRAFEVACEAAVYPSMGEESQRAGRRCPLQGTTVARLDGIGKRTLRNPMDGKPLRKKRAPSHLSYSNHAGVVARMRVQVRASRAGAAATCSMSALLAHLTRHVLARD